MPMRPTKSLRIHNIQEHIKDLPIVLEEQTVALDETTVTAQRVVMEFDRQIIYPGKQEKETAIDGIDLVDKLQLHGIVVGKVEGTISGVLGGTVKLRVNGGPADLNDLKQIDPKMVRWVEYHDMPSMRYGKVEAVIDLYVKRQGFGGSGRVDASHSAMSLHVFAVDVFVQPDYIRLVPVTEFFHKLLSQYRHLFFRKNVFRGRIQ